MPSKKKNLQTPKPEADPPVAPKDFWEQVDELHMAASQHTPPPRPENSFTRLEYCQRYKCSPAMANRQIGKLRSAGKVKVCGSGSTAYYVLVQPGTNPENCTKTSK